MLIISSNDQPIWTKNNLSFNWVSNKVCCRAADMVHVGDTVLTNIGNMSLICRRYIGTFCEGGKPYLVWQTRNLDRDSCSYFSFLVKSHVHNKRKKIKPYFSFSKKSHVNSKKKQLSHFLSSLNGWNEEGCEACESLSISSALWWTKICRSRLIGMILTK